MLRRTVVSIEQDSAGALTARLSLMELNVPRAREALPLTYNPMALPPLDTPQHVQDYGEQVRDALQTHPAIQQVLQNLFQTPAGQPRTLCFDVMSPAGEQIRWEALCDDQGDFVALNGRFQLGRIADEATNQETSLRPFSPPLKLAAFLSAAGRDATAEWTAIRDAIVAARAKGLSLEARFYVGQQALLDQIGTELAAGTLPGVTVHPMPASDLALGRVLDEWRPHLVHFFCHGSTGYGNAYLELATITDHDKRDPHGSVVIAVSDLVNVPGFREAWLVVLNCCEGATATERLTSMAFRIVADGQVPAVVGMQEPVPVADANAFSKVFYPELLDMLARILNGGVHVKPILVDMAAAVGPARRAIRNRHAATPATFRNWTLPVLYLHREPLQVQLMPGLATDSRDDTRRRIELIASYLRSLPPGAPLEIRRSALALLDLPPAVPLEMRPDLNGIIPVS